VWSHAVHDTSVSPLECNSLRHTEPMKTDERVGDVVRLKAALLWHFVLTGDAGCE